MEIKGERKDAIFRATDGFCQKNVPVTFNSPDFKEMLKYDQEKPILSWLRLILGLSVVCVGTAGATYLSWRIHWVTGVIITIPVWILLVDILINRRQSIIWYFLDFFRHLLVFGGTAFAVQFLWKTDWRLGAIAVIPIFVLLLNLFGFITIHLYNYTPEVRAGRKKYSDEDECDLWEHSFHGYKEEQAAFDRDLTSLLDNEVIIDSLRHFGYDADFLTNIMERLRAIGNAKAVKTLLRDPSKVNRVLETFSREDWTDMSKIISVSNYLEYGL